MADSTLWWLAAGVLVASELISGTFYLLMLAVGLAAGALSAHAGLGATSQIVIASVIGAVSVIGWHVRRKRDAVVKTSADRDINLDVGETVQVDAWSDPGHTSVKYRGAQWSAVPAGGSSSGTTGPHRIVEVRGSQLVLEKISS